jgi:hypothetical protein
VLPAVALDAAQGPAALRTLVISGHQGEISYRLVGAEPGSWSRDLPPEPAAATSAPVTAAVQAMAAPSAGDGDAVTPSLRRLAIGFVIVDRTTPASVAARLDSAADLARLGSSSGRSVWRVVRPAGRVVIAAEGADEGFVVPSGAHATVDENLPAGTPGRRLLLAEPASTGWRATLDGRSLEPVADSAVPWRQAFTVPPGGGELVVRHVDPVRTRWLVGQAAVAGVALLLALAHRRRPT